MQLYRARFSLLALLKDASGAVVKKVSQMVPLEGSIERLDTVRQAYFLLYKNWQAEPGEYTLEAVVFDAVAEQFGAQKLPLRIDSRPPRVSLSSLVLIDRVEQLEKQQPAGPEEDEAPPWSPFEVSQGRIVPATTSTIAKSSSGSVSYYFVIYPDLESPEETKLTMEYYLDGQLVGTGAPELPAPEEDGTIPYISTTPASAFPAGNYLMQVKAEQGGGKAAQQSAFTIVE